MKFEEVCKAMPKVELHAHLNGCISDETLLRLSKEGENGYSNSLLLLGGSRRTKLAECFEVFKVIHEIVRTPEILYSVTRDVIRDFSRDNVVYVELRTTPKKIHSISSKEEYLESVIRAIIDSQAAEKIVVKLLLSIDRKMGPIEGAENVELAAKFSKLYPGLLVGIDSSGDPSLGSYDWILPLLNRARKFGLGIAAHLPEIADLEATEKLLAFQPNRMGHGLYLHPSLGGSEEIWEKVKKLQIPIEACLTSNLLCGLSVLEQHYVTLLHADKMPYIICTDDTGVFNTTLSEEFMKFLQIVPLSLQELKDLCLKSVDYCFTTEEEKGKIRNVILDWWTENKSLLTVT